MPANQISSNQVGTLMIYADSKELSDQITSTLSAVCSTLATEERVAVCTHPDQRIACRGACLLPLSDHRKRYEL